MRKLLLKSKGLFVIVFLMICSCSSSSDSEEEADDNVYFGSFKVDGETVLYQKEAGTNNNVSGSFNTLSSDNNKKFTAGIIIKKEAFVPHKNSFQISLANTVAFQENLVYTNAALSLQPYYFAITFLDENGDIYTTYNEDIQKTFNPISDIDAKISFTKVTDKYLEGTFSGTIYNGDDSKIISEGKFKIVRNYGN